MKKTNADSESEATPKQVRYPRLRFGRGIVCARPSHFFRNLHDELLLLQQMELPSTTTVIPQQRTAALANKPEIEKRSSSRATSGCQFVRYDLVHITPDPGLAGLDGAHQRMLCFVKMFGRVLVL
jgi:hypothetical protein